MPALNDVPGRDGQRFPILAIAGAFTRESLALALDTIDIGYALAHELDTLIAPQGRPKIYASDNGLELISFGGPQVSAKNRRRLALFS